MAQFIGGEASESASCWSYPGNPTTRASHLAAVQQSEHRSPAGSKAPKPRPRYTLSAVALSVGAGQTGLPRVELSGAVTARASLVRPYGGAVEGGLEAVKGALTYRGDVAVHGVCT